MNHHCHYDHERSEYITADGDPCRVDEYGDPTRHCTAKRTCSQHVGPGELTCARCLGRTRANLRRIPIVSRLMMLIALEDGVNSEAANLAGPAADPEAWSWRKVAARQGKSWHLSLIEDDDEEHPYLVLGRWDMMLREDYSHPSDVVLTIANAAAYLDGQLGRMAQDDTQDFPLFSREVRDCRNHLERVLRTAAFRQRGVPCPTCVGDEKGSPRLVREYGHWCEDDDCRRVHYLDDSGDVWRCPRNAGHVWEHERYENYLKDRRSA
jgi:hypothetical protein